MSMGGTLRSERCCCTSCIMLVIAVRTNGRHQQGINWIVAGQLTCGGVTGAGVPLAAELGLDRAWHRASLILISR